MSVNKAILLGRLGAEPNLRYAAGQPVCELSLATNESFTKKTGERQESTTWHRVVVWGKQAELCRAHLGKGSEAFVEGRIHHRTWEGKDGQKRFSTEIVAHRVQFVGGKRASTGASLDPGESGEPREARDAGERDADGQDAAAWAPGAAEAAE